ncbi:MAG: NADH-quinone oxidoreductase subunit F, partial [Rhodobacterales bacterium]|nr:NADH-quinone oxidoreductase subunit F [Rhodobacterales bacterium]
MALDDRKGVWKSGKGKGRHTPKGRQYEDQALIDVQALLGDAERRSDLLIEFLHLIQDEYGHLSAAHLRALAEELKLSQAEVFEVATFYAHFDVVKEDETPPPALTIRVCDSLSCELAGRCDTAPVLEIGHKHIDHATPEKVDAVITAGDYHAEIPDYETLDAYVANGGYETLKSLRAGGDWEAVQDKVLSAGLRGLGGAGFPSDKKWGFVRANAGPRYLAVNGDEGEPGTFK